MQNNIFVTILVIRRLLGPHDFHSMKKYAVIDWSQWEPENQNMLFYVEEKFIEV